MLPDQFMRGCGPHSCLFCACLPLCESTAYLPNIIWHYVCFCVGKKNLIDFQDDVYLDIWKEWQKLDLLIGRRRLQKNVVGAANEWPLNSHSPVQARIKPFNKLDSKSIDPGSIVFSSNAVELALTRMLALFIDICGGSVHCISFTCVFTHIILQRTCSFS